MVRKEAAAALPLGNGTGAKERDIVPDGARMARLVDEIAVKKVPVSSLFRFWTLGTLQARVAAGYLASWLRSLPAPAAQKDRLRREAHLAAALQLFGTMGYLRGAVMKVGQMLATLPEVLPEEFAEVLSALHFEAPPMHYALVREVFLDEFGREPEELFASFDREAFAAASLGQVHRARLASGEEVAVKIQYPGIARTIRADLRNLRLLLQPLALGKDWQNTLDKLDDIEQMLLMETDYEQEARFSRQMRSLFAPDDGIVVPRVFDEYTTTRVLTTQYLPGCHLERFLSSNPGQAERDHFTTLLTIATMRAYYRLHWFMADPHPGNFIFMPDGRLGLIDFGCTRAMTDDQWSRIQELEEAHHKGDAERFDQVIARASLYDSPEAMGADQLTAVRRNVLWNMEPWLKDGLFDFGDREFFRRGIDSIMELTRKRYTRGCPLYLWSTRFVLGGRAVCYRMRGRCDFRKIFRQESAGWIDPPRADQPQPEAP
jgi:predicted unusual protein kinase regulating ubiquinone biosynthesis (AarF/ABC1/UbiB family)